ncbi:MAG: hypothetical protein MUC31_05160 [Bacteroidales bacterium]|nr:hypothetical protein [Bacteroidales bacterium]
MNLYRSILSACIVFILLILNFSQGFSQKSGKEKEKEITDTIHNRDIAGLKFRSIGPALTSGRIADFAVNPSNSSVPSSLFSRIMELTP